MARHEPNQLQCHGGFADVLLVRRDAFVPLAEGNSLAVDLVQWCMERMQDGMRHVYTPHCVVKADAESAFEGFRVKVPAGWYDPCATGSKRA